MRARRSNRSQLSSTKASTTRFSTPGRRSRPDSGWKSSTRISCATRWRRSSAYSKAAGSASIRGSSGTARRCSTFRTTRSRRFASTSGRMDATARGSSACCRVSQGSLRGWATRPNEMNGWVAGPLLVLLLWALALLAFAAPLRARWREPVFRHPLLVIESDDWGAGPLAQAEILDAIASTLRSFRDRAGRHPVMTLGIVLEAPDAERMKREGLAGYYGRGLDDAQYAPLRNAIESGVEAGVFARQ